MAMNGFCSAHRLPVPNMIADLDQAPKERVDKPVWRVAFFGRLDERKGIKLFVDAVQVRAHAAMCLGLVKKDCFPPLSAFYQAAHCMDPPTLLTHKSLTLILVTCGSLSNNAICVKTKSGDMPVWNTRMSVPCISSEVEHFAQICMYAISACSLGHK